MQHSSGKTKVALPFQAMLHAVCLLSNRPAGLPHLN